ncbi:HSP20-like chaperone [Hygrophoropsis aurantiaca]|uniref:HSP20-like chaperone n=1 Tax=Hygrophoropsis aurantiaca TaxID=72124 RepID=A0ACB8ASX1_9AGAM|nr:HSP20-like chaperone [Hygrophoropsis aurantiaca]
MVHPEILWAQRSSDSDPARNIVYLTVNLPDIKPESLTYDLTPTSINFKASAGATESKDYEFSLELFGEIIPEESKKTLTTRSLTAVLRKKEAKTEYWPRLTKEKLRTQFIKTNFDKWVDEDEQDGAAVDEDFDMGGMGGMPGGMSGMPGMEGLGGMGGMGGPGGMGGMDFEKMMASMGGAGGAGPPEGDDDDVAGDDSDDDGPPPLEDA